MIRTLCASTSEIDEVEDAVAEILEQLDLENGLLKHSVGVLSCYADFLDSGVVEALCAALPFDVVGCTSLGNATNAEAGLMSLSLCVLTSDDVSFTTALTAPLGDGAEESFRLAYEDALTRLPGTPDLIIPFAPMLTSVPGERMVRALDAVSGGVPLFGTMTCDHTHTFRHAQVLYKGQGYRDCLAMILAHGPVDAKFQVLALPVESIHKQWAIITESEGTLMKKVNNGSVLDFLASLGLVRNEGLEALTTIPFIVDYNDGTPPVARGIQVITEEGYAFCGGEMPVNSTLAVGAMEDDDVMRSLADATQKILSDGRENGALIISCMTRCLALCNDPLAEMEKLSELVGEQLPYMLLYSGGEICPVPDASGKLVNRYHNYSLTACLF